MKKSVLFASSLLAISVLGLASCSCSKRQQGDSDSQNSGNTSQGGTSQNIPGGEEVAPGTEVTVYLDLGSIGLYKGQKGQDIPAKFLENAIEFKGKAGQDSLPSASDITATSGAKFVSWVYYAGGGAPVAFDKVPLFKDLVLLANFSGGEGTTPTSEPGGSEGSQEQQASSWYVVGSGSFLNGGAEWNVSGGINMWDNTANTLDTSATGEYVATITFSAGDLFKVTNGTVWVQMNCLPNTNPVVQAGEISMVDDGNSGKNGKVNTAGAYTLYFKTYAGANTQGTSGYSLWIEHA